MSIIFHCTKLLSSKCNSSWVVAIKQNANFKYQPPAILVLFVFHKNSLIKSCSFSEDLTEYKVSWSCIYCKFCIHLRSLNVCRFGMVAAAAFKLWHRGHLQRHDLTTEFHNYLKIGSQIYGGGGGGRQTDRRVISLAYMFPLGPKVECYPSFASKILDFIYHCTRWGLPKWLPRGPGGSSQGTADIHSVNCYNRQVSSCEV
jgi:hypothetical protein